MKARHQLCISCDCPTGRCDDDTIYRYDGDEEISPLCEECAESIDAAYKPTVDDVLKFSEANA